MQTQYYLATLKKVSLSVSAYFQKEKSHVDLLASIGQPLGDAEIVSYILVNRPSNYDSLVTSVNTCLEPFSLDEFVTQIST
jgi:hypothetical protein